MIAPRVSRRFLVLSLLCLGLAPWGPAFAQGNAAPALAPKLQPFVDNHTLAGAVLLVANKDEVLDVETVGFADIAGKKPLPPDAVFWIASMTKPITAAALMVLVDEGKVSIDDPVEKHLPDFKDLWLAVEQDQEHVLLKRPQTKMTVRHILSHTSGFPFKSAIEQNPTFDTLRIRDCARSYTITPLLSEPGTKYLYSNAGINTAGRIIEVVSGMPYEQFLQQKLFVPLGMQDTTFWPNEEQTGRLAKPYKPNADKTDLEETTIVQLQYPLSDRSRQPIPGGGLFSTARDVSAFCRMLLNKGTAGERRVLSEESVKQLTSRQTAEGIKENYGLGFSLNGETFGHGGALSTNMTVDKAKGLVLVYMVQHAGYGGTEGGKILPAFHAAAAERFGK